MSHLYEISRRGKFIEANSRVSGYLELGNGGKRMLMGIGGSLG